MITSRTVSLVILIAIVAVFGACGRRPPPPLPPAGPTASPPANPPDRPRAPGVAAPELELHIEPGVIERGESALMTWQARHAERVTIDHNIGEVDSSGKIKFFPEETTTYRVVAEGRGGRVERSVVVEVIANRAVSAGIDEDTLDQPVEERFKTFVKPVFFAFDSAELSQEAQLTLEGNLRWLSQPENAHLQFVIEGHCDERGTEEYNLALGDKRAQVVSAYLVSRGIASSRITTLSLGEEQPVDPRDNEEAYQYNRRAQFILIGG